MEFFYRDDFFVSSLINLLKIKERKKFLEEARKLETYTASQRNPLIVLRLAFELDIRGIRVPKLENFIIRHNDPRFIFRFAREIKYANIKKLQNAIIAQGDILQISRFGCFIKGADQTIIENIIAKSNNAKAAYYYIRYVQHCNIEKLKTVILQSKRPRYLFALARLLTNKKDLELIQDLILKSNSYMYMRMFAMYIDGANISKIEDRIVDSGNLEEIKKFSSKVKTDRMKKLSLLF